MIHHAGHFDSFTFIGSKIGSAPAVASAEDRVLAEAIADIVDRTIQPIPLVEYQIIAEHIQLVRQFLILKL